MKECSICGNTRKVVNFGGHTLVCGRHWHHLKRHGRILQRTRFDPAHIIHYATHCELIVYNNAAEVVGRAKFDKHHAGRVAAYHWSMSSGGYPRTIGIRRNLHQVIMGEKPGMEVDHKDGDKMNNLDSNLRWATHSQNGKNLKLSKRNRSGHKGILWDKINRKWSARICVDFKQIWLGRHTTLEEAVAVRAAAEKKYYGEFSRSSVI